MKSFRYFGKSSTIRFPEGERLVATGAIIQAEVSPPGKWQELKAAAPADNKMALPPQAAAATSVPPEIESEELPTVTKGRKVNKKVE